MCFFDGMAQEDTVRALKNVTRNLLAGTLGTVAFTVVGGIGLADARKNGETEFKTQCAACHFEGGNVINPDKTLSKADREKNGIRTARDIINLIRNPGKGMTVFDESTLPETEAQEIAEYILTTYQ
jgi:cytochrome c6